MDWQDGRLRGRSHAEDRWRTRSNDLPLERSMKTEVSEIADKIYRLSTFVPQVGPTGFTFNQFLIDADQPLLFHYGQRALFPLISEAVKRLMPLDRLCWTTCSHVEADESGAL